MTRTEAALGLATQIAVIGCAGWFLAGWLGIWGVLVAGVLGATNGYLVIGPMIIEAWFEPKDRGN